MVKAPTPEDDDSRRLCRERKTLIAEQVQHVKRIKGLLFSQGVSDYEPLWRNRRQRLDELKTGDGRPLPPHLKAQISRELDRLDSCSSRSSPWRAKGMRFWPHNKLRQNPRRCCSPSKA